MALPHLMSPSARTGGLLVALLVLAPVLSACTQDADPVPAPAASSAGAPSDGAPAPESPAPEATAPETPADGIRGWDFANASWRDAASGEQLTLVDGVAESGDWSWAVIDSDPAYGDLNGDGVDDAVVGLSATRGEQTYDFSYVWLWDAHSPTQVPSAITDDATCGNETDSMRIADGEVKLVRLIRDADSDCADPPTRKVANTIAIDKGFPVRTSPVRASTDRCLDPAVDELPARQVIEGRLFLAPSTEAPYRTDLDALGQVSLGGDESGPASNDGWVQVLFHAPEDKRTWYCAWFPGE